MMLRIKIDQLLFLTLTVQIIKRSRIHYDSFDNYLDLVDEWMFEAKGISSS